MASVNTTTTYTAICQQVGKWWEITVPELDHGRVTQARSLDDVEATVRDLVVTMTGAQPTDVRVDVQAPAMDKPWGERGPVRWEHTGGVVAAISHAVYRMTHHTNR